MGTVVRPIRNGMEAAYDIDLVCQLGINKTLTSPEEIKSMVGNRLKEHETYLKMLDDEMPRCWTLNYAEQDGVGFHMDILPSTPEDKMTKEKLMKIGIPSDLAEKAIAISDKNRRIRMKFIRNPTLNNFVQELIIPYLYSFCHKRIHKTMPYGELSHGGQGILEFYCELFNTKSEDVAIGFLRILAGNYRGHQSCPCGSGNKLRDCHGESIRIISTYKTRILLNMIMNSV